MKTRNAALAMRMLRRNWSAGELRVLVAALFIAVASVTSVAFFADRVQGALDQQANELLGGDLVVIADQPMPPEFVQAAAGEGLATAQTRTFPSMVSTPGGVNLAEVKAVTAGYPLRGRVRITTEPGTPGAEAPEVPAPGTVWIGAPLVSRIGARVGDTLTVGRAKLAIAAVITREPDSVLDYFGIAPRVLMNDADVEATGLVQLGSRVGYRLLVAGEADAVARLRKELTPKLARGQRIEGVRDARSEVRMALERAQRFLGLASLLSVVLASVAVALAARRFSQRQVDAAAMMRCLGATQADLFAVHAWQFAALGAVACALGSLAGFGAQAVLAHWLTGFFTVQLPLPGPLPALRGAAIGLVLMLGFTLPPLIRLRNASTLRVLRRDLAAAEPLSTAAFALGLAALAALIVWQAGELRMGAYALAGFAGTLAASALAGYGLIRLVSRMRGAASGPWRYGLANLRRRTGATLVQVMALGLGLMAMLVLTLVRTELITKWQESLPPDMPNRFAINIQTDQLPALRRRFDEMHLVTPDLYPMVRGRLTAINERSISASSYKDERARRLAEREFNLSWSDTLKPDNSVVAGRFWKPDTKQAEFSVEEGIAKSLGIKLGDTLAFEVAGSRFAAEVTSLRKVNWDSFKPNFFVVSTPAVLSSYPASWITSFHLPEGRDEAVAKIVREFPNVSVIDMSAVLAQFQRITDQVSRAVEFVFVFAIAAGLVVLFAAITSTQDERVFEGAVLRTIGANRRQLTVMQLAEFLSIGLLAGVLASAGAVALATVLAERVLGVAYDFHWALPLAGIVAGGAGVALAGLLGTRRVVAAPPLQTIRAVS
ncbi:MAG TPA: FtsX-like permease family protein [Usitatibacter sp.]|nr:FtsX-like permease family protein [Usitatibacter sp.]